MRCVRDRYYLVLLLFTSFCDITGFRRNGTAVHEYFKLYSYKKVKKKNEFQLKIVN